MRPFSLLSLPLVPVALLCMARVLCAQSDARSLEIVRTAVNSEVYASAHDHSDWMYVDHDAVPGKDAVYFAVQTPQGSLRRMISLNGREVGGQQRSAESNRIALYVSDPSAQAKKRRDGAHDDAQTQALLQQLPEAYVWTLESETPEFYTLSYKPNPAFSPPSMASRVMASLDGIMIVARQGNRIRTLRGELPQDLKLAFGLVHLYRGGSFDVERREVGPGDWQITEQHVHILGHALLMKTIGQQEDEEMTQFTPSRAATLVQAQEILQGK